MFLKFVLVLLTIQLSQGSGESDFCSWLESEQCNCSSIFVKIKPNKSLTCNEGSDLIFSLKVSVLWDYIMIVIGCENYFDVLLHFKKNIKFMAEIKVSQENCPLRLNFSKVVNEYPNIKRFSLDTYIKESRNEAKTLDEIQGNSYFHKIKFSHFLETLKSSMKMLKTLENFNLTSSSFQTMPETLFERNRDLKRVKMFNGRINFLPAKIFLSKTQLESIDLAENKLVKLEK